jgi:hypothetical protein
VALFCGSERVLDWPYHCRKFVVAIRGLIREGYCRDEPLYANISHGLACPRVPVWPFVFGSSYATSQLPPDRSVSRLEIVRPTGGRQIHRRMMRFAGS